MTYVVCHSVALVLTSLHYNDADCCNTKISKKKYTSNNSLRCSFLHGRKKETISNSLGVVEPTNQQILDNLMKLDD